MSFRLNVIVCAALLTALGAQTARAQSGPVAAYAFDDGSGTVASDASGNGLNGSVAGATWEAGGRFGSALSFNGTSAMVTVGDHNLLDLTTGMTLEAWVYPTARNGWSTVLLKERPGELAYAIYGNNTASRPAAWITAGAAASADGTAAVALNTWTHLAATYDGATLRFYVNGILVRSRARAGSLFVSGSPLRIGGNAVWGEYFQGRIDEVRIYARALTAAQIQQDMTTPVVAPVVDTTPPAVAITSPAQNATVSGLFTLSASATDNIAVAGVQFLIDGALAGSEDTAAPYSVSFDSRTLTNTLHQVTARARDGAGNIATSASVPVTASNPPRLVITAPAAGANVSGTTVPVTYTTVGDLTGVDHVHFQIDGGAEIMDVSFDGIHQLVNVTAGPHVLNGWLVLGNHSKIAGTDATPVSFSTSIPDTTPPTVQVTGPAHGATVSGTIQLTATAGDAVGVVGVQFFVDGTATGAEDPTAPYEATFDTRTLTNASHQVTARARDAAGNVATSAAVPFVASNPPRLVITGPVAGATFSGAVVPVSYTTAGDITGVNHVHFQLDGGAEVMDLSFDGVYQLSNVAPGAHVLNGWLVLANHSKITGTDAAPVSFSTTALDTTPPAVQVTAPAPGATVTGTIQITATATDAIGVVGVQFLVDGNLVGAEDTSSPYSISFDTRSLTGASHQISASARDAAGNSAVAASVLVTVSNPTQLVAAYGFDDGAGAVAGDASGNGLTASISGATWTAAGRFGSALSFNGTSSLVTIADHSLLDLTTGMTVQAWVYPTALSGYQTVLLKERPGELAYALYSNDDGQRPAAWITTTSGASAGGATALALNAWTHLAATYDGANLRLFVNGTQVSSTARTGSLFVSGNPLRIGGNTVWGEYFQGRIDEVRVYSRALSSTEIQADMITAVGGGVTPPTWTVSGSISPASVGGGVTVTLTGGVTAATTTDASGNYTIPGVANGTFTVTPSKPGVVFTPGTRPVTVNSANVSGVNFSAQAGGITLIQSRAAGAEGSVPSMSATFSNPNTAGNFLIVTGTAARPAGTISISDTAGNTYIPAIGPVTDPSQEVTAYIWYVPSAIGGGNTVTLSPASPRPMEIHISEWSGVANVSPLDQTAHAAGTGTVASSGARTTTVNGELIFGYTFLLRTATAGPGFTPLSLVNGDLDEYQVQSAAGSIEATFTQADPVEWFVLMATFKPATIVGTDVQPPTVTLSSPAPGAVSGAVNIAADATDNVAVVGVQFRLDGSNLGVEDTSAPYSMVWDASTAVPGTHSLTAIARDAAGNSTTSAAVAVEVSGSSNPAISGRWDAPFEMGTVAVNMVLLHTGSVLFYPGQFSTSGIERLWHATTGVFTDVPLSTTNLFCSGHSQLADGRILVIGGHDQLNGLLGSRDANIFDPVSQTWSAAASMTDARWYPSATTLSDGRVLALSGATTCVTCIADVPEVYDPRTNSWSRLTAARLSLPYYPFTFLLPDGRVLYAGANEQAVATRALNVATQTWTMVDPIVVEGHSAAMYRPGRILKSGTAGDSGSSGQAQATAYVIDMNQPSPTWRQVPSMAFPRAFHNTVILPTGDVLITGGGRSRDGYNISLAVKDAELWSPATETWRTLAAAQLPRLYHSSALLLPDGRVLVAGGGNDGPAVNYTQGEIFSPPYLFQGQRPTISAAPQMTQYAATFAVDTPDAANITSVSLIRPGAVTHAFDEDQRFLELTFVREAGRLVVSAPANANLAPPGYYMLFLVAGSIPSTATFIRLPSPVDDVEPPSAPTLSASNGVGSASLVWTASTDATGVAAYNVHRSITPGVVPSVANRIVRTSSTAYVDAAPGGTYYYVVTAEDTSGNISLPSNEAAATIFADTTAPSVSITSPSEGAAVSASVAVSASAFDDTVIAGVRFELDGLPLGVEDVSAPYSVTWATTSSVNGPHVLSAIARDSAGNQTRSTNVTVSVSNTQSQIGLVAAFGFNELTGSSTADASGNGNAGQLSSAVWSTSGRHGGALAFNGTSSMVSVADAPSLDLTIGMTLEAWVNPSQLSGWRTAILKERGGDLSYALYAHDNAPRPSGYVAGPAPSSAAGTAPLTLNTWTHLAVTYDGSALALFVNGVEVRRVTTAGAIATSTGTLRIGGNLAWGEYFSGLIDEVRIYNRALTAGEIQIDMGTPIGSN